MGDGEEMMKAKSIFWHLSRLSIDMTKYIVEVVELSSRVCQKLTFKDFFEAACTLF